MSAGQDMVDQSSKAPKDDLAKDLVAKPHQVSMAWLAKDLVKSGNHRRGFGMLQTPGKIKMRPDLLAKSSGKFMLKVWEMFLSIPLEPLGGFGRNAPQNDRKNKGQLFVFICGYRFRPWCRE